jgi:hypothetical protein
MFYRMAILILISWSSTVLAVDGSSHCASTEKVVFNCHVGKKLLSLCMARPVADQGRYMQYRFGPLNRPELVFPKALEPAATNFFYSTASYSAGGEARVRFSVNTYDYIIYSKITSGPPEYGGYRDKDLSAGLVVLKDKKQIGHFQCKEKNSDFNFPDGYLKEEDFDYSLETP